MNPFVIGTDRRTGRSIMLRPTDCLAHAMVSGGTGMGKSVLALALGRYCLGNGLPALFLDPHGDAYWNMVAYATATRRAGRIITIDLNAAADAWVFPLNFLHRNHLDPATHAGLIMRAIQKVFAEDDSATKPRLERRLRAALIALIEAGCTLADLGDFLTIGDTTFRESVLARVTNSHALTEWREFDRISKRAEKETLLESVLNRAAKLISNDAVRRLVGTATCNLDWEEIRTKRQMVLVNLQPVMIPREAAQVIGTMLLDNLVTHCLQAPTHRQPMLVIADEFDEISSPDFASMFQALRKRKTFAWCFFQYLQQLRAKDDTSKLLSAALSCCDIKIAFHTSYEDGQILARELFPGAFRGDIVKDEIHSSLLLPRESRRTIVGRAESEAEAVTETEGESESESFGTGTGMLCGSSLGHTDSVVDDAMGTVCMSDSAGEHAASSVSSSSASGSSRSWSTSRSRATGRSRSETVVPFYEYEQTTQLSSRSFYSVEEQVERRIAAIQLQERRMAIVKIGDRAAIPIITAFVPPLRVRPRDVAATVSRLAETHALPAATVDQMIAARRQTAAPPPFPAADNCQALEDLFRPQRRAR